MSKTYYVEGEAGHVTAYNVKDKNNLTVVTRIVNRNKGWFTRLIYDENSNITVEWKTAIGAGTVTIPAVAVFKLVDALPILNHFKNEMLCGQLRIYSEPPINQIRLEDK